MNILLVIPPSFAETVCSSALIRCISKQLPGAKLHVLADAAFAYLLQANPYIGQLHVAIQAHTVFRSGTFDVLIDLAALEENRRWAKAAAVRYLSVQHTFFAPLLNRLLPSKQNDHLATRYLQLAKPLGVAYDGAGLDYFIPDNEAVAPKDIPTAHSAGYIALVLQSNQEAALPLLQAFCQQVKYPVMLVGDGGMQQLAGRLSATDPVKIYAACGKFSDNETADLLRLSRLVIAPDGGWMQVAAAQRKPLVALRRSQSGTNLFPPLYPQHMLQQADLPYTQVPTPRQMTHIVAKGKREGTPATAAPYVEPLLQAVQEKLKLNLL